jgi:hypothetical protein
MKVAVKGTGTSSISVESSGRLFESGNKPLGSSGFFYSLFGRIEDALRGSHFASNQEVKEGVLAWLVIQPKIFVEA